MQPVLKFNVRNQNISRMDTFLPVRYSRNYLYAEFDFKTCDWNEKTKTAIFSGTGLEPIPVILGETDTCLVPWEVLECTEFTVTVHAGDLITVDSAKVKLYESGYRPGDVPEPTPDVYQQLINMLTDQVDGISYTDNILSLMAGEKNIASVTITVGSGSGTGREIELQNDGTHIQWRYVGEESWTNLIALEDIKGPAGPTGEKGDPGTITPDQISEAVEEYMASNPIEEADPTVPSWAKEEAPDKSLTQEGKAADAKEVGDRLNQLSDEKIDNPSTGSVGQILEIESVDINGKPKTYKSVDKPSGNGSSSPCVSNIVKLINYGDILGDSKEDGYCCWTAGMCKYDEAIDKVVFMYNAKNGHVNGTCRVYMRMIDCQTLEISDSILVADQFNIDETEYPAICYFFFIKKDGTYEALVKAGYIDNNDKAYKVYKFLSRDHGATWTVEETDLVEQAKNKLGETFYGCFNPVRLSNGRIIGTAPCDKQYALYSDDDGDTWTLGTSCIGYNEGQIIELETEGHLVSINRNSNAYTTKTPAYLSYSEDYGDTWTQYGASVSISDMTANNACYVVDNDNRINLFYGSRYSGDGFVCTLYKQSGTLEQLANDELDDPVVVLRGTAIEGQDFGYPACCKDQYGQIYLVYYDGYSDVKDKSTIKLSIASRQNVYTPINDAVVGKTNVYSAEMVEKLLADQYRILITKINNIIINGGGEVEDGNDGTYPVTSGLLHWFDVNDIVTGDDSVAWSDKVGEMTLTPASYDSETKLATFSSTVTLGKTAEIGATADISIEMIIYSESRPIVHSQFGTYNSDIIVEGSAMYVLDTQYAYNDWNVGTHKFMDKLLHVVLNADYTNGLVDVYVNGKLRGSVTAELNENSTRTWYLCDGGGTSGNIRIYNRPLTADEVTNNYKYEKSLYTFDEVI